jgi:L-threonylcarbamoyladenylate synthase
MLARHYSPGIPFYLSGDSEASTTKNTARIVFGAPDNQENGIYSLSETGKLVEAAQNLFGLLRKLDEAGYDAIFAELLPEKGLGRAINDRLRRAASRG